MGIPLDKAELLSLFIENIIYGIFLTFYIILIVISSAKDPIRISNQRFVLPVATLMMVLATAHLILDFVRLIQGFVTGEPTRPPNPIAYYEQISNPLHVAKTVLYVLQTILGDGVLVWRCYIVNNRSLYIMTPAAVVLMANLGIGMVVVWSLSAAVPGANIFQTASRFIESFFILTMGLNLCCTAAIVFRIWNSRRNTTFTSGRSLFPAMAVIIESGAIYTASVTALLISYLTGSNGQYPALDLITPLVGVTYCLIVLQIHFHLRVKTSTRGSNSLSHSWTSNRRATTYELRSGVAVHITEHAETRTDSASPHSSKSRKVPLDEA